MPNQLKAISLALSCLLSLVAFSFIVQPSYEQAITFTQKDWWASSLGANGANCFGITATISYYWYSCENAGLTTFKIVAQLKTNGNTTQQTGTQTGGVATKLFPTTNDCVVGMTTATRIESYCMSGNTMTISPFTLSGCSANNSQNIQSFGQDLIIACSNGHVKGINANTLTQDFDWSGLTTGTPTCTTLNQVIFSGNTASGFAFCDSNHIIPFTVSGSAVSKTTPIGVTQVSATGKTALVMGTNPSNTYMYIANMAGGLLEVMNINYVNPTILSNTTVIEQGSTTFNDMIGAVYNNTQVILAYSATDHVIAGYSTVNGKIAPNDGLGQLTLLAPATNNNNGNIRIGQDTYAVGASGFIVMIPKGSTSETTQGRYEVITKISFLPSNAGSSGNTGQTQSTYTNSNGQTCIDIYDSTGSFVIATFCSSSTSNNHITSGGNTLRTITIGTNVTTTTQQFVCALGLSTTSCNNNDSTANGIGYLLLFLMLIFSASFLMWVAHRTNTPITEIHPVYWMLLIIVCTGTTWQLGWTNAIPFFLTAVGLIALGGFKLYERFAG